MCFLLRSPLLFISNSVDLRVIVVGDLGSLGPKSHIIQLGFGADDHSPLTSELEVRTSGTQVDFTNKLTGRVPDVDTIPTASVDVAFGIAVDPYRQLHAESVRTIWESDVDESKSLPISP